MNGVCSVTLLESNVVAGVFAWHANVHCAKSSRALIFCATARGGIPLENSCDGFASCMDPSNAAPPAGYLKEVCVLIDRIHAGSISGAGQPWPKRDHPPVERRIALSSAVNHDLCLIGRTSWPRKIEDGELWGDASVWRNLLGSEGRSGENARGTGLSSLDREQHAVILEARGVHYDEGVEHASSSSQRRRLGP